MNSTSITSSENFNTGLLIVRVVFGLLMAAHGTQKLLGWFGGYGIKGTGEFFVGLGYENGRFFATAASLAEIIGGSLIAFGFLGPIGPALLLATMIVAAVTVHLKNGVFASTNGIELTLLYGAAAVGIALTGYGTYSIDSLSGIDRFWTPTISWLAILGGAIGGFANLAIRRKAPAVTAA